MAMSARAIAIHIESLVLEGLDAADVRAITLGLPPALRELVAASAAGDAGWHDAAIDHVRTAPVTIGARAPALVGQLAGAIHGAVMGGASPLRDPSRGEASR
jgi:hypothetical protein